MGIEFNIYESEICSSYSELPSIVSSTFFLNISNDTTNVDARAQKIELSSINLKVIRDIRMMGRACNHSL
jgi:hypothetical protein